MMYTGLSVKGAEKNANMLGFVVTTGVNAQAVSEPTINKAK